MSHHALAGENNDHHIAAKPEEHKAEHRTGKGLFQTPVNSFLPPNHKSIITVKRNDHVSSAFKILIDNKIQSAPVYCVKEHKYIGFIDIEDIVTHALAIIGEPDLIGGEDPKITQAQERFCNEQVGTILDLSKRNPWKPVEGRMPISVAIDSMTHLKVHRIPVIDGGGELVTLITQSQIVSFIHDHILELPNGLAKKTVGDLKLGYRTVATVSGEQKVVEAFKIMHDRRYSAVAVVNDKKQLVGNISLTDLKLIGHDAKSIRQLLLTVAEFVKLIPQNEVLPGPICVHPTGTFEETLTKMVMAKVHRVYVVDPHSLGPIGVITQGEILRAVLVALA